MGINLVKILWKIAHNKSPREHKFCFKSSFLKNGRLTDFLIGNKLNKTELCLFHKNDHAPIQINLNGTIITSKTSINVLGVQFDSKLNWNDQVNKTINKAKKTYHAISLIKKYFNHNELNGLLTSNYYSVLYYNNEIWHLPTLSPALKQKLMSASANALKLCLSKLPLNTSHESIHRLAKRGTPPKYLHTNMHSNSTSFTILQICQMIGSP